SGVLRHLGGTQDQASGGRHDDEQCAAVVLGLDAHCLPVAEQASTGAVPWCTASMRKRRVPPGMRQVTTSPTRYPSSAVPSGAITDMRFRLTSACAGRTSVNVSRCCVSTS